MVTGKPRLVLWAAGLVASLAGIIGGIAAVLVGVSGFNGAGEPPAPAVTMRFGLNTDWQPTLTGTANQNQISQRLNTTVRLTLNYTDAGADIAIGLPSQVEGAHWAFQITSRTGPLHVELPDGQQAAYHRCQRVANCLTIEGTVSRHFSIGGLPAVCNGFGIPVAYDDFTKQATGQQNALDQVVRFTVTGAVPTTDDQDWSRRQFTLPETPITGVAFDPDFTVRDDSKLSIDYETPSIAVCEQYSTRPDRELSDFTTDPTYRSEQTAYWVLDGTPRQPPAFSVRRPNVNAWVNVIVVFAGFVFAVGLAALPTCAGRVRRGGAPKAATSQ